MQILFLLDYSRKKKKSKVLTFKFDFNELIDNLKKDSDVIGDLDFLKNNNRIDSMIIDDLEDVDDMDDSEGQDWYDIDSNDVSDPNQVVDYVDNIYQYLKLIEDQRKICHDYMKLQTDLSTKMRIILVDWIIEVHKLFKLIPETLFLTVDIIDRYLEKKNYFKKPFSIIRDNCYVNCIEI